MKSEAKSFIVFVIIICFWDWKGFMDKIELKSEGFMQVYKEIADIIGPEATYAIYRSMRGQQVTFPKRLYTSEYIIDEVLKCGEDVDIQKMALEYDYTERYLRQLLKIKKR
jgi:hypothetical protein